MSRFIVYGAGAIGGVIGAELFERGHDVLFIARGAHREVLGESGLRYLTPEREIQLDIPVVGHPSEIEFRDDDVAIVAVKSQNTEEVISLLAAYAPLNLPIVCAQNGIANENVALRRFANVYGACAMIPATHRSPGEVIANASPVRGMIRVGRYPRGIDATVQEIAVAISSTRMVCFVHEEIRPFKYAKLIGNLGTAAFALISGDGVGSLARKAEIEGETTLRQAKITFVSKEDLTENYDAVQPRQVNGWDSFQNSSWQSLAHGQGSIESDYLNGEIVWLGRLHGVPTPVNLLLQRLANDAARRHQQPRSIADSEFLKLLL